MVSGDDQECREETTDDDSTERFLSVDPDLIDLLSRGFDTGRVIVEIHVPEDEEPSYDLGRTELIALEERRVATVVDPLEESWRNLDLDVMRRDLLRTVVLTGNSTNIREALASPEVAWAHWDADLPE
jgi:hypothetical protein